MNIDWNHWKSELLFAAVFFGIAVALLVARRIVFGALEKWSKRTETETDDIVIAAVRGPSFFWAVAIALYVALGTSSFSGKFVDYALKALNVIIIISVTVAVANLAANLARYKLEKTVKDVPVTGLSIGIIKGLVLVVGALIVLNGLGVSITPLLTALGVGGLAVALALQDTLSNMFAGVYMLAEKTIKVGDYISTDTGVEGYVEDIGWRTTRVRRLQNNVVIIPNNKLTQSVITNYYLPDKSMAFNVQIGVGYGSDVDVVEKILLEEAIAACSEVKGLLKVPPPNVRLIPGFGESSLNFTLTCHVDEFQGQLDAQHELRKRIFKRFKKEGIEIPYPVRTVYMKQQ